VVGFERSQTEVLLYGVGRPPVRAFGHVRIPAMPKPQLVLASQSPRRRELLTLLGFGFTVVPSRAEETPGEREPPTEFVTRVARDKGEEVAGRVSGAVVLSADTIVVIDDNILGKPIDENDAIRMLERLSGRQHSVYTGVAVLDSDTGSRFEGLEHTKVWFSDLSRETIKDYVRREDVTDKAGAYAIQGFAGVFIPRIEGNYHNVVGLPLPLTHQLLCQTSL
jgi:septum formation protein